MWRSAFACVCGGLASYYVGVVVASGYVGMEMASSRQYVRRLGAIWV